jgi:hypothetical protein
MEGKLALHECIYPGNAPTNVQVEMHVFLYRMVPRDPSYHHSQKPWRYNLQTKHMPIPRALQAAHNHRRRYKLPTTIGADDGTGGSVT